MSCRLATTTAKAYADGINEIPNAVENYNEAFDKKSEDFNFQWNQTKVLFQDIIQSIGKELLPLMKDVLTPVRDILMAVREWPDGVKRTIAYTITAIAVVGTLGTAVKGLSFAWGLRGGGVAGAIGKSNKGIGTMMRNVSALTIGIVAAGYALDQAFNNNPNQMHGLRTAGDAIENQSRKLALNIADWTSRPARAIASALGGRNAQGLFDK